MTGVSAIQYFSVDIFKQVGIDSDDALKYQAINNILALIAQAMCVLFVDRFGRRVPLILGNVINGIMFLIATILIGKLSSWAGGGNASAAKRAVAKYDPTTNPSGSAGWGFIIV